MKTVLLIDGNAIMHRAYHALPPFKTSTGIPTGAVYGFLSMLYKIYTDFKPSNIVVCFDTPVPTFRKKIFVEYQSHRPKMEDELKTQFPNVKEALDAAGVKHIEEPGFEADDLIGTLSKKFSQKDARVLIISGDRDLLQLVNKNIFSVSPQIGLGNTKIYDKSEVLKKFGIAPLQVPDFKALAGDPSDNYSGAPGIGPKTAAKLLNEFKTIENLYKNLDKVENEKIRRILIENKKPVLLSKQLATIIRDIPVKIKLPETDFKYFNENLKNYLMKYQMSSLIKRFFEKNKPVETQKKEKINVSKEKQIGLF